MKLSEVGRIKSGITLSRQKPRSSGRSLIIKVFKTSHCKPTDTGSPPEPENCEVDVAFSQPRQILEKGDILISKRFTHPGCVVFKGSQEPCYVCGSVVAIRPHDKEIGQFVADYLNSDAGKKALMEVSQPTPYQSLRSINVSDIKSLETPVMSREEIRDFSLKVALEKMKKKSELNKRDVGFDVSQLVSDIKTFMRGARSEGLVEYVKGVEICAGKQHSVIVSKNGVCHMENFKTGGFLVFRDDYIIASQGISDADIEKFSHMAGLVNETESVDLLESLSGESIMPTGKEAKMTQLEV